MKITVYWIQFIFILLIYSTGITVGASTEMSALGQTVISIAVGGLAMFICTRSKRRKL